MAVEGPRTTGRAGLREQDLLGYKQWNKFIQVAVLLTLAIHLGFTWGKCSMHPCPERRTASVMHWADATSDHLAYCVFCERDGVQGQIGQTCIRCPAIFCGRHGECVDCHALLCMACIMDGHVCKPRQTAHPVNSKDGLLGTQATGRSGKPGNQTKRCGGSRIRAATAAGSRIATTLQLFYTILTLAQPAVANFELAVIDSDPVGSSTLLVTSLAAASHELSNLSWMQLFFCITVLIMAYEFVRMKVILGITKFGLERSKRPKASSKASQEVPPRYKAPPMAPMNFNVPSPKAPPRYQTRPVQTDTDWASSRETRQVPFRDTAASDVATETVKVVRDVAVSGPVGYGPTRVGNSYYHWRGFPPGHVQCSVPYVQSLQQCGTLWLDVQASG